MQKRERGITLIALVITIIILLILAGISISSLTNNGLFGKTEEADRKTEIAQIKEEIILDIYAKQLSNLGTISYDELVSILDDQGTLNYKEDGITIKGITTEKGYEILIEEIYTGEITSQPKTLASVVNVGDYVAYIPDTVAKTDTAYTNLISELETYSGSDNNESTEITQEILNWRVLDIIDGKIRLISEKPTDSVVWLAYSEGYNNAVYLLDKTCSTLYNNSIYADKVQSLKIEDIEKYSTYDYTQYVDPDVDAGKYGDTKTHTDASYRYYPNIFAKEKTGWVDGVQGTELGLSEQTTPINEASTQAGTSIKTTQTYWEKSMTSDNFTDSIYYNLFISNDGINKYPTYWMSSRCVSSTYTPYQSPTYYYARFGVYIVSKYSGVTQTGLYYSKAAGSSDNYRLRPVITLKSNVLVNSGDGASVETAYELK